MDFWDIFMDFSDAVGEWIEVCQVKVLYTVVK